MRGDGVRIGPTARTVPDRPTDPPEAVAHLCGTCYWFEPCPCGRCGWGVCRQHESRRPPSNDYVTDEGWCEKWREA